MTNVGGMIRPRPGAEGAGAPDAQGAPTGLEPAPGGLAGGRRRWRVIGHRLRLAVTEEDGMSTVEYAVGTIAAAAFGAVLYTVVTGDNIVGALTDIIDDALSTRS